MCLISEELIVLANFRCALLLSRSTFVRLQSISISSILIRHLLKSKNLLPSLSISASAYFIPTFPIQDRTFHYKKSSLVLIFKFLKTKFQRKARRRRISYQFVSINNSSSLNRAKFWTASHFFPHPKHESEFAGKCYISLCFGSRWTKKHTFYKIVFLIVSSLSAALSVITWT